MPIYEVELSDGRTFEVESDAPPSEQDVMAALGPSTEAPAPAQAPIQEPEGSGGASATIGALRAVPAAKQGLARFAANHPAATQKVIGAGISTMAGGAGAAVGGVPGAVVGASIRGVTPAQSVIRETAGKMAGESAAVAKNAGRATAVAEYAKPLGLTVNPSHLVSTGNAARALDNYADAGGLKVPRVLDQFGKVVYGPEAPVRPKPPGVGGRLMTGAAKGVGAVGKALGAVAGPVGLTDLAQTIEPNRRDIGVMGIGASQPTPQGAELDARNKQNTQAMDARVAQQQAQLAQLRAAILTRLGLD
jgi:hypothetical protein